LDISIPPPLFDVSAIVNADEPFLIAHKSVLGRLGLIYVFHTSVLTSLAPFFFFAGCPTNAEINAVKVYFCRRAIRTIRTIRRIRHHRRRNFPMSTKGIKNYTADP